MKNEYKRSKVELHVIDFLNLLLLLLIAIISSLVEENSGQFLL